MRIQLDLSVEHATELLHTSEWILNIMRDPEMKQELKGLCKAAQTRDVTDRMGGGMILGESVYMVRQAIWKEINRGAPEVVKSIL